MPIRINENDYLRLSESEKHVIDYINEHEKQLSELSITTIAQKSFTSLATVSRAIRKCGYSGIAEMRYSLSNKKEDALLATDDYRGKVALGIFEGLCAYFGR